MITAVIDGKTVEAPEGKTILEAAQAAGIAIPSLCYHPDLAVRANCRMCQVKVEGERGMVAACATKIRAGMKVETGGAEVRQARKTNLELILSQHREECDDCVWYQDCQLLKLAREYDAKIDRFTDRKKKFPVYRFGPIVFDQTKCIDCRNCVEMCGLQQAKFLELKNRGSETRIEPSKDKSRDCIYCGQCIVHCPAGAIEADGEFEDIEKPFKDKGRILVAQFAPSIRSSLGEAFGMPAGTNVYGQLVAALRKLGFDKVFDVSTAADFTTIEEAEELAERIKEGKNLPLFTSCCPAWVKYVEFYRPDLIPNLTSVKSPQNMLGSLIKTFYAETKKIDPGKITVVSIMPCTAKKNDVGREEDRIRGLNQVDCVLTTRELGFLLKKNEIRLDKLAPETADDPFGLYSGAGVIYGATGGVMESAIRTAYWKITGRNLEKLECENVRGIVGLKKARVAIGDLTLKAAVANGMTNAKIVLDELAADPRAYDYVEIMACPGGCIGGGGQPMPVNDEIRRKRANALYRIDCNKETRVAHENKQVQAVYDGYFKGEKKKIHEILHTCYNKKPKGRIRQIQ